MAQENGLRWFWPFSLGLVWWLVIWFREPLRRGIASLSLPRSVKFFALGLFFYNVVMENLAVSFEGDLHPSLWVNTVLWVGAGLGVFTGWWLLAQWFQYSPAQVFLIYGLKGVVVEQDFLLPKLLWKGDLFAVAASIPLLVVVYGAAVAPVFVILSRELPRPARETGWLGAAAGFILPGLLFYLGFYVWVLFVGWAFGIRPAA
jgi:hypothetical protein